MINILIVNDSQVTAGLLENIFHQHADMKVIGIAANGMEAVTMANELEPDIITMDIMMPIMDGIEATTKIMKSTPVPIVVLSSLVDNSEMQISFKAIEAGALSVLPKPVLSSESQFEQDVKNIVESVRAMSDVKVITRRKKKAQSNAPSVETHSFIKPQKSAITLIGLGASTGGPQLLQDTFKSLPEDFPLPIVVAQHISPEFVVGLIDWLNSISPLTVKQAEDHKRCLPGIVYLPPENHHIAVTSRGITTRIKLSDQQPINHFRPSINFLFDSIANSIGAGAAAGLLTGMGNDGVQGLKLIKDKGGHTFVQDEESSVIYGMPQEAIKFGASDISVSAQNLPEYLCSM